MTLDQAIAEARKPTHQTGKSHWVYTGDGVAPYTISTLILPDLTLVGYVSA